MNLQTENPMHDIVASGLHRLAQPISSALWSVELADQPESAPLPHVAGEMRRAAGILHVLRSLMEAGTSYPEMQVEDLAALVADTNTEVFPQLKNAGLQCQGEFSPIGLPVRINAQGFKESYRLLLEKFLWLGVTQGTVRQGMTSNAGRFTLTLACESDTIAQWTKLERERLLQEIDPFDTPGFDFSSRPAPELTLAKAILASATIELSMTINDAVILFTLQGPINQQ
jgi:hypothetical protein